MPAIVQPNGIDGKHSSSVFFAPAAVGTNSPSLHVALGVAQQFVNAQRVTA